MKNFARVSIVLIALILIITINEMNKLGHLGAIQYGAFIAAIVFSARYLWNKTKEKTKNEEKPK